MQTNNLFLLLETVLILGCGIAQITATDKTIQHPSDQRVFVNNKKYIEVTGFGVLDPHMANLTQRRALAREAATVNAQSKMLAAINSLRVPSINTEETPTTERVRWAKVVKTEWLEDGRCGVTLRLNKKEDRKITGTKLITE